MAKYAAITGWGMAVPERTLTNADLERMVATSDEWIQTRTGIRERRIIGPGESTSSLAAAAGRAALDRAGLDASAIDHVILATCTPDRPFPATACTVQAARGAQRAVHRLRCVYPLHQLERSEYLCVVRRWRRRGRAATVG